MTLFQGEWVVFVEAHHDAHEDDEEHREHTDHDEDEEESPYTPKVVKIIAYAGEDVAIEGINKEDEYVSAGVYFVKSMLLKSSLGGHGH